MSRWPVSRWAVLVVGLLVLLVAGPAAAIGAAPPPSPPDTVATSENVFLSNDQDVSECISALPPPSCGSEARGGWRQTLVFVAIGLGVAFIVWRIVRSVRPKGAP